MTEDSGFQLKNPWKQKHAGKPLVGQRSLWGSRACPGIYICFFVKSQTQKRPKNHPTSRWCNLNPESILQKNLNGAGFFQKSIQNNRKWIQKHSRPLPTVKVLFSASPPTCSNFCSWAMWSDYVWNKGPSQAICIPGLWVSGVASWLHANHHVFANWKRQTIIWKWLLLCFWLFVSLFTAPAHSNKKPRILWTFNKGLLKNSFFNGMFYLWLPYFDCISIGSVDMFLKIIPYSFWK